MKTRFIIVAAVLLSIGSPVYAHRLDEYLQATLISVEKDHVQASMRLIPGVAVFSTVFASIDSSGDGVISDSEQRAYAEQVLHDVSLAVDGLHLVTKLLSVKFPSIDDMKEGLGEIQIEFTADLPSGGASRRLIFENHHHSQIAAYLVNCLVPRDRDIRVLVQERNEQQSFYQLDYVQGRVRGSDSLYVRSWSDGRRWLELTRSWFPGSVGMFRLGMRHIAEGTDHLLFLLTLLLPAPLLVSGSRWLGFAGCRHSLSQILKVVTAFTFGHSITLALAGLGLVHVASRPIEVLIAVSILVSAAHALRPLFPKRAAAIAALFGLIHGLAFAASLGQLGLNRWERVVSILGFNLGIETMQIVVVATTMPSLILLSRTRTYPVMRIIGALIAGFASVGWIAERLLNVHTKVDSVVDSVAHHALWIAGVLLPIIVISSYLAAFWTKPLLPNANTRRLQRLLTVSRLGPLAPPTQES
ncbi:MAG TPA: HupE/UreJ family protein [Terriglobales bacterium]|nr:HupE/UreJ family protein [Terriglobales bacterium]